MGRLVTRTSIVSGGGGGADNPGGYTSASVTMFSFDYETSSTTGIVDGDNIEMQYAASGGPDGAGHWKAVPLPVTSPNDDPGGQGWGFTQSPSPFTVNTYPKVFISGYFKITSGLVSAINGAASGFWGAGNKVFDIQQWNQAGTNSSFDSATEDVFHEQRWVVKIKRDVLDQNPGVGGVYWSILAGGAGIEYMNPDNAAVTPVELSTVDDIWVWMCFVFESDVPRVRIYMKQSGGSVTLIHERTDYSGPDDGDQFLNNGHGFHSLRYGMFCGYWDDIVGTPESNDNWLSWRNIRVHNGWPSVPSTWTP